MAELAWTTARHFCLSQMEQELLEELDKEKRLSHLFNKKVTLEGLQMFVSVIHPEAERDVQTFLPALHSKLLKIFGGIQIASYLLAAEDAKPAEFLEFEQSAAALVPEVVDTALKFLLEEPEQVMKSEAASAEIGKHQISPIYRFDKCSKSFKLIDYDESYYHATEGVISAIQDMDYEVQTDASSQAHHHLEEELLEKREASSEVSSSEELEKELVEDREASP
ncbi:uncharacterized protein LOC144522689 [Sander vitreus]